jgi:hypothetical protein
MPSKWKVIEPGSYSEQLRVRVETELWYDMHFSCLFPTNVTDTFNTLFNDVLPDKVNNSHPVLQSRLLNTLSEESQSNSIAAR